MSKRKNNLQIVVNIYLLLIFIIPFVVGFFFSTRVATITFCILLIPFLLGQALVYGLNSQIRGMEMILKNPPTPGEEIDLSLEISEQILTEIPFKPLCKEECRGLCPECGAEAYIMEDECCALCGESAEHTCGRCGCSIPPEELGTSLCGYCDHMMSKDD